MIRERLTGVALRPCQARSITPATGADQYSKAFIGTWTTSAQRAQETAAMRSHQVVQNRRSAWLAVAQQELDYSTRLEMDTGRVSRAPADGSRESRASGEGEGEEACDDEAQSRSSSWLVIEFF